MDRTVVDALNALWAVVVRTGADAFDLVHRAIVSGGLPDLHFPESGSARLLLLILLGAAVAAALLRMLRARRPGRSGITVPALLGGRAGEARVSPLATLRYAPTIVAAAGVLFFAVAIADPRTGLTRRETSYPGRRIALMIDASSSMLTALPSRQLARGAPNDAAFFTTVGAARHFVELRRKGEYRDLMSLIEFGDEAYVITPFTSDYDNILLSISLIGDWNEFMNFPDQGTVIARAIDQAVNMFRAFDFLDAAGNAMVIFSDGMDADVLSDGRTAFDVLRAAERADVPVYFIRTNPAPVNDPGVSDAAWMQAVARTGGRFYNARDEAGIVRALADIDRDAAGRIEMRQYATQVPRFEPFVLLAAMFWTLALAMRLAVPLFQKFP